MNLIDTHAHLYYDQFAPDFDQAIVRAKDVNLKAIINIGTDLESSKKALVLESNQIKFYSTIGIHPQEATQYLKSNQMSPDRGTNVHQDTAKLEEIFVSNPGKVVAVGECGLDYHFEGDDYSPSSFSENQQKDLQKQLFKDQIRLAKTLGLPLIIHCRDGWDDVFVPELQGATGVFHSFTATEIEAKKALDMGYYLGFSCIVTYPKNEHLREIINFAPLDKILTETDCPYLPPQNQRGQRNEPSNVSEVIKVIAEVKSLSQEEVARATWENAVKLFSLPTNLAS